MVAYLVLLLAALSRLFPHALHGVGLNITAVGGGLLFFGARRPAWQAIFAVIAMALTDVYLTAVVYASPFHVRAYLVTWAWYGGVCLLGRGLLHRVRTANVLLAVVCSATSFFLLSNFEVWLGGGLYPHTWAGAVICYELALPFYANDLVSTGLTAALLFGLPVVAAQVAGMWQRAERQYPLG